MSTKLHKLKPSMHEVVINDLSIFFSYETPIAFRIPGELVISNNEWGVTTGEHLNRINSDKSLRIPHEELLIKLEEVVKL